MLSIRVLFTDKRVDNKFAMEDAHRLFLQSIMCKGLLDGTQVRQLYREVCLKTGKPYQREHQKENIGAFVMTINTALKPMEQRIEKVFDEMSGKQYFCFINLDDNELTRLLIPYSKPELELFKKMVEEILMTEDGLITTTAVLNLVRNIELRLSMKDAEEFLGKLKESRWIEIEDGQVALSIRAIHELEHYIRRQFADFAVLCNICKRLVVRGQCCSSCDVKIHNYCASKYFKEKKEMMCPKKNCKTPWPDYDNDTDAVLNRSFDAMEPSPRKRPR